MDADIVSNVRLYTFEWFLHNYQMIKPLPRAVKSPTFVVGLCHELSMKMYLSPNNDGLLIEIYLLRNRIRDSGSITAFKDVILNLEFLDSDPTAVKYYESLPGRNIYSNRHSGGLYWRKQENISTSISSLHIRAKLSLQYPSTPQLSTLDNVTSSDSESLELLSSDMKKLLNDENYFPDISVKVGDRTFLAHYAVVQNQLMEIVKLNSEFNFIHTDSAIESTSRNTGLQTIFMPNEDPEVFFSVLHYVYTGKIYVYDTLDYFKLYEFTKKYNIHELSMVLKPTEMYTESQMQQTKFSFTWYVKNFSSLQSNFNSYYYSPNFQTGLAMWNVMVFVIQPQSIFINLQRASGFDTDIQTAFKLKVCYIDGTVHDEREFKHFFQSNTVPTAHPNFLCTDSVFCITSDLLFNDTLTISCDFDEFSGQIMSEVKLTYTEQCPINDFRGWTKHLYENMLKTKSFADFSLLVEGEEIPVHKMILTARSPVFKRMLQSDMIEKLSGRVEIKDISYTTMKLAVHYIYTGKLDNITMQYALELFSTADKYELCDLKNRCRNFIIDNLDAQHAPEVLMLADVYKETVMKEAAERLICTNADVLLTSNGLEIMTHRPELVRDLLQNLSAGYCSLPPQNMYE